MAVRSLIASSLLLLCVIASGCGPSPGNNGGGEEPAADKAADDKAAADKAAAEKAAADKAAAEKAAADKAAADKAAAEQAAAVRSAKRVQAITKALQDYLYNNDLNLTGGIGVTGGSTPDGGLAWTVYRDSLHSPADADKAVRTVYREAWRAVEQQGAESKDPRELPADKRAYRFDLHYTADGRDGVVSASFLPFEGDWAGDEKKAARLSVQAGESVRK